MFTGNNFLFSFSFFSLLLLHLLVVLIVLLYLLKHTETRTKTRDQDQDQRPGLNCFTYYLNGLWQVFDGQVKPDAQLQREDVLPVRSVLNSKTTNKQQ